MFYKLAYPESDKVLVPNDELLTIFTKLLYISAESPSRWYQPLQLQMTQESSINELAFEQFFETLVWPEEMRRLQDANDRYEDTFYKQWLVDKIYKDEKAPSYGDSPYMVSKEEFLEKIGNEVHFGWLFDPVKIRAKLLAADKDYATRQQTENSVVVVEDVDGDDYIISKKQSSNIDMDNMSWKEDNLTQDKIIQFEQVTHDQESGELGEINVSYENGQEISSSKKHVRNKSTHDAFRPLQSK